MDVRTCSLSSFLDAIFLLLPRFFARCIFFFKQKTAYELRISDWSSYVCSSDLHQWQHHALGCSAGADQQDVFSFWSVTQPFQIAQYPHAVGITPVQTAVLHPQGIHGTGQACAFGQLVACEPAGLFI